MLRIAIHGNLTEVENFVELIKNSSGCSFSGLYSGFDTQHSDIDKLIDHPLPLFDNFTELLKSSDAVIFLKTGINDIISVKQALKRSKHVFIQPEDMQHPHLLNEFQNLAEEAGVLFYVFHKPIIGELENLIRDFKDQPEFIDISRKVFAVDGKFPDIRKLVLNEILFLTSINQQAIKKFKTISVPYNSENPYLVNIRIDFANYSSANLSINNYSGENSRNTEVFFRHHILNLNTTNREIKVVKRENGAIKSYPLHNLLYNEPDPSRDIDFFIDKLKNHSYPANSSESGINAYINSWEIMDKIIPAFLEK